MPEAEAVMRCSVCDSEELEEISGESPTGVVAPDGGCERRGWVAWKCLRCGAMEEQ